MVPVVDATNQFRQTNNQNIQPNNNYSNAPKQSGVSLQDFKSKILGDYLKLTKVVTTNMNEILCALYRDLDEPQSINFDQFLKDLFNMPEHMNTSNRKIPIRLFKTEDDVEDYQEEKAE